MLDGTRTSKFADYLNVTDPRDDAELNPQWVNVQSEVDGSTGRVTYQGKTFTLRMDVINVLNKPQWGNPNVNINGSTFGRITSVIGNQQRLVTLNARIDF